ncbi:MAG: GNAT family N-acetyltransferase [Actinobacteria bacterium]|nr:GNAT family N-acetyltransferase [Actinomycetota bacterium]
METRLQLDCESIDWEQIPRILERVGMAYGSPDDHEKAFRNSSAVVFVYDGSAMVGFGRAISDGVKQAAIYDIAVLPDYQGEGLGRTIINNLLKKLSGCNILLYANPGKDVFYERFGFRRMRTGMALFADSDEARRKGFID